MNMQEKQFSTEPLASVRGRSLWGDAWLRLRRDWVAMLCLGVILLYTLIAIVSPIYWDNWQREPDYSNLNASPSEAPPLGTDALGRSVLEKTFLGAHVSMTVGFMSNIIAVPLGMILGAVAGYYGRWIDDAIVWLYTTLASIPGIIRLIALKFAFADKILFEGSWYSIDLSGMAGMYLALGLMSWIGTCRIVRAETMKLREADYVLAAKASGRGSFAILMKHIIPNVLHVGIVNFSLGFVGAIMAEIILSYLSLGVQDFPSWGQMIASANMDMVVGRWWELASAVVAIFLIVLALNIFGDRLRDALDPRLKNA